MNTQQPRTVIFFGIQGSGKGTQAQLLKQHLEETTERTALYLETGQLLRDFNTKEGYTNTLVAETMNAGELLPSFMPVYVLARVLVKEFTGEEHLIVDGATRRLNQTIMIDNMLRFYKRSPYDVVLIELPEDEAVERLKGRGRKDDTEENIRKRITWSREHMDAVLQRFESSGVHIHRVNGEPDVETIHRDILEKLQLS